MTRYRSASPSPDRDLQDLNQRAIKLSKNLIPEATLISSLVKKESIYLLLRNNSTLIAFELYDKELNGEIFESILKSVVELESKRKNDETIKEISIYLIARSFSDDFLPRIPVGALEIRTYEWRSVHSRANGAMLIRQVGDYKVPIIEAIDAQSNLGAPELIALARLGIEVRERSRRLTV